MLPADPGVDRNGNSSRTRATPRLLENLQELNYLHLLYFWTVARDGSIAGACARLQISQPTISMQIRKLEKSLGHRLFDRSGRSLVLTEVGRTVYEYADEMFSLGRELLGTLRGLPGKNSGRLHVGIPTYLPKLITYHLLEPVLRLPQDVQLICHEDDLSELVSGLARHRFDAILSDTPIYSTTAARTFSHPLGECEIVICAAPALAAKYRGRFPHSLEKAPLLLPTPVSDMRRLLDRWFDSLPFNPRVVAEFDDSALMKEFGTHGGGLFPMPAIVLDQIGQQYGVELVGRLPNVRVKYYMVTTDRKIKHPATAGIVQTGKSMLQQAGKASGGDDHLFTKRPGSPRRARAVLKPL